MNKWIILYVLVNLVIAFGIVGWGDEAMLWLVRSTMRSEYKAAFLFLVSGWFAGVMMAGADGFGNLLMDVFGR